MSEAGKELVDLNVKYDGHVHCWHKEHVAHIDIMKCCRCAKEKEHETGRPKYTSTAK